MPNLIQTSVEDWWTKGVLIRNLRADQIRSVKGVRKAAGAFVVGMVVVASIEFLVVLRFVPKASFAQLFGVPLYAVGHVLGAGIFILLLIFFLRVLRVAIPPFRTAALTLYALSGLLPLAMFSTVEIWNEAISLFVRLKDPSSQYMLAAILSLLGSEHATLPFTARVWIEALAFIGLYFYYIFWHLRRLLIQNSAQVISTYRITLALLLTVASQYLLIYTLVGRIYWVVLGEVIRSS
jgi:hypothetical protein